MEQVATSLLGARDHVLLLVALAVLAAAQVAAPPSARASGGGLDLIDDDHAAGILVGLAVVPGVLLTYAVVGVEFDGLLVPKPLALGQLGVSLTATTAVYVYSNRDPTMASMAVMMAGYVLAIHAIVSLIAYEDDPEPGSGELFALMPGARGSLRLWWHRRF